MSVIDNIRTNYLISYWKLYAYISSFACICAKSGIISARLAIVKVLSKFLRAHLSTPLSPLCGAPPRPRDKEDWRRCSRASVPAHNPHLDHRGGAGAHAPFYSLIYRVRCYYSAFYVPRETISNNIFFLVCNKVKIKVHSYKEHDCICKSAAYMAHEFCTFRYVCTNVQICR